MKYLIGINELYKSTYKRASDRLKTLHKGRSNDIIAWAEEKGVSEFKKKDVEREWPHPFEFKNNAQLHDIKDKFLGKFFITGNSLKEISTQGYTYPRFGITVCMKSEWGQIVEINIIVFKTDIYKIDRMEIKFGDQDNTLKFSRNFLFNNRKDAVELRKYLIQNLENFDFSGIRVNDLYKTD